jgi:hypothetical protein
LSHYKQLPISAPHSVLTTLNTSDITTIQQFYPFHHSSPPTVLMAHQLDSTAWTCVPRSDGVSTIYRSTSNMAMATEVETAVQAAASLDLLLSLCSSLPENTQLVDTWLFHHCHSGGHELWLGVVSVMPAVDIDPMTHQSRVYCIIGTGRWVEEHLTSYHESTNGLYLVQSPWRP